MLTVLIALLLSPIDRWQIVGAVPAGADRAGACEATGLVSGPGVRVHGRLFAANGGGSGYRIWLVGTKRIVWVPWRVNPPIPDSIVDAFKPFDEELYGDFTLVPLAADQPGAMREMCFVGGEHLVVRDTRTGKAWRLSQ